MAQLAFYSTASGNTRRFVDTLSQPSIEIGPDAQAREPFVLITPTYGDGEGRHSVPKPVIRFLNDPANRALLRGVIAGGNRNFGQFFAHAGKVIAAKCGVPVLYRFELSGTAEDTDRVITGLERFWTA